MKIFIAENYETMSEQAADDLISMMSALKQPLICTASGDSPAGLYKQIVQRVQKNELDISDWLFVGLDEWAGMNGDDEGSCRYHLDQQLFHPLQVPEENICFFDGRKKNLQAECDSIENFIHKHNGIDIAILGLGINGHIGMNEPGTSAKTHSHVSDLHPTTQQVGQKYFKKTQQLTQGITLGIATLMEARSILLIVNGKHKADIVKEITESEISEQLPATLLKNHPALYIYLDTEAASEIKNE